MSGHLRLESVLRRWRVTTLLLLASIAAAVRWSVHSQLVDGPCLLLHRWTQSDMHYFDQWARAIAAGDTWSKQIDVPMHQWQQEVARAWLADPAAKAAVLPGRDGSAAELELWRAWCGERAFYQEPLYAYALAGLYRLGWAEPHSMLLLQLLAGVLTVLVVHALTARWFGASAAAIAGLLAATCAPLVCHELVLVREPWIVLGGFALLLGFERLRRGGSVAACFGVGVLAGALLALKTVFLPLVLCVAIAGAIAVRRRAPVLALACGLALVPATVALRHAAVDAKSWTPASGAAVTFACANVAGYSAADGGFQVSQQIPRIMGEAGGRTSAVVAATLATHDSVLDWLALVCRKLLSVWHWYDVPDNANLHYWQLHSPTLAALPATSWVVLSAGCVGLLLSWRRRRRCWPLHVLLLTHLVPLLLFFVSGRLRLPLIASLIPFASLALVAVARAAATRTWATLTWVLGSLAVAAWLVGRPLPTGTPTVRPADYFVAMETFYWPEDQRATARGDLARSRELRREAARVMRHFLRTEPAVVAPEQAAWYSEAHRTVAGGLAAEGRHREAGEEMAQAARLRALLDRPR